MKRSDVQMLIRSIARSIKQHFTRRVDHDALVQRVEQLERQVAELKSKSEEAA